MEQPLGHILHLVLGGVAVAHQGLLDLHGLVGIDLQPSLPDGKQNHTPALGHTDAGGDILAEEQLFDGHHIGLCDPQQLYHIVIDDLQPPGKIRIGRCGDGTAAQQLKLPPVGFNEAEAGDAVARVDT